MQFLWFSSPLKRCCAPKRFPPPLHTTRILTQTRSLNSNTSANTKHAARSFRTIHGNSMAVNGVSGDHSMEELSSTLKSFGVQDVPSFPNSHPTINPVDIYRAHVTELLQPITGADPKIIYPAVQWTSTLEKGDAILPVPALRLKGKKPDEIANAIGEQVKPAYQQARPNANTNTSSLTPPSSKSP